LKKLLKRGDSASLASEPDTKKGNAQPRPGIGQRIRHFLLSIDSMVDTGLWRSWSIIRRSWEAYDGFLRRFRAKGIWRGLSEVTSDGLTYGTIGFVVVLAFAQPAIEATRYADWKTTDDFAVTFLDRFGQEIGRRGIVLNDSVPLEEIPDSLVKATLATEDRRFFMHFGIDFVGTFRAMVEMPALAGLSRAARHSPSSLPRTCSCPTSAVSAARSRRPISRSGLRRTSPNRKS
jgi:penicillin-binding protein 1A